MIGHDRLVRPNDDDNDHDNDNGKKSQFQEMTYILRYLSLAARRTVSSLSLMVILFNNA